jgi:hypothetical protein
MENYEHFRDLIEKSFCYICQEGFTESNKPTLDRENNKIGHTKVMLFHVVIIVIV